MNGWTDEQTDRQTEFRCFANHFAKYNLIKHPVNQFDEHSNE